MLFWGRFQSLMIIKKAFYFHLLVKLWVAKYKIWYFVNKRRKRKVRHKCKADKNYSSTVQQLLNTHVGWSLLWRGMKSWLFKKSKGGLVWRELNMFLPVLKIIITRLWYLRGIENKNRVFFHIKRRRNALKLTAKLHLDY